MWTSTAACLLSFAAAPEPPPILSSRVAVQAADSTAPSQGELAQAFLALEDEYQDAYDVWLEARRAAIVAYNEARESGAEVAFNAPPSVDPDFFPRFDELAGHGHLTAQVWCMRHPQVEAGAKAPTPDSEADFVQRAMALMNHGDEGAKVLPSILARHTQRSTVISSDSAKALLLLVESASQDAETKSSAAYYLASAPAYAGIPDDVAKSQKVAAMRGIVSRYAGTKSAERADSFLYVEENLQIGMVAPEISGKDVDGNDMKLTDFRGKVTVIDFWGFW